MFCFKIMAFIEMSAHFFSADYLFFPRAFSILVSEDEITCYSWTDLTHCLQRREAQHLLLPIPGCTAHLLLRSGTCHILCRANLAFRPGRTLLACLLCWGSGRLLCSAFVEHPKCHIRNVLFFFSLHLGSFSESSWKCVCGLLQTCPNLHKMEENRCCHL